MSVATTATLNLDVAFMIRSGDKQMIIVANGIDFAAIGLALLRWFLGVIMQVLDATLGWIDVIPFLTGAAKIWVKHLFQGIREEKVLWKTLKRLSKEILAWF